MSDRKAYVVTSGCYSDYRIMQVFDNRAAADRYVNDYNSVGSWVEEAEVEVWPLLDAAPEYRDRLRLDFYVPKMKVDEQTHREWAPENFYDCQVTERATSGYAWWIIVQGFDHEKVRKVFSEKKAWAISHWDVGGFGRPEWERKEAEYEDRQKARDFVLGPRTPIGGAIRMSGTSSTAFSSFALDPRQDPDFNKRLAQEVRINAEFDRLQKERYGDE